MNIGYIGLGALGGELARWFLPTLHLQLMVKDLGLAARLGMSFGAPMMISNAVRSLFLQGANRFGGTANVEEIAHLYESTAGIRLEATRAR